MSNVLYHSGVKGQRKGVRNGPPYPLDRTPSGRISSDQKEKHAKLSRREKKKFAKSLYSDMKKQHNMTQTEMKILVKNRISEDDRVKEHVTKNYKNSVELSRKLFDTQDKRDEAIDKIYQDPKKYGHYHDIAVKEGWDPNQRHFDDMVSELIWEDPTVQKYLKEEDEIEKKLKVIDADTKKLTDDIIGKYGNRPMSIIDSYNATAKWQVELAIDSFMYDEYNKLKGVH